MRTTKLAMVIALATVLAIPAAASAGSARDRATGGGQINIPTTGGAGDTVAFSAQEDGEGFKGQIQIQLRDGTGTGRGQTTIHAEVTCLDATGNMAYVSGVRRDGSFIGLYVVDTDGGAKNDADILAVDLDAADNDDSDGDGDSNTNEEPCNVDDPEVNLGRGNVQVHDADLTTEEMAALLF